MQAKESMAENQGGCCMRTAAYKAEQERLATTLYTSARGLHTASDEMRGGLHAMSDTGSVAGAHGARLLENYGKVPVGHGGGLASGAFNAAQQVPHPGRMFTCAEILAVLKSRKAILEGRPHFASALQEVDLLISTFERMK